MFDYKIYNDGKYIVCEFRDGSKYWYLNGKSHRESAPAIELAIGTKYWYINGKCHREDGPAIENYYGKDLYYFNNIWYPNVKSQDEFIIAQLIK